MTGSQIFKLMGGVQESLAGRVAVLSLTSLSQAEIAGADMEPFTIEMEALVTRKAGRTEIDTRGIFERIYKGSMPAIVSGVNSNSQIFTAVICLLILSVTLKNCRMLLIHLNFFDLLLRWLQDVVKWLI